MHLVCCTSWLFRKLFLTGPHQLECFS